MKHSLREYEAVRCTVKHSLRSREAKRTFFTFHVAKQRFIAEGCFMSCCATRLMHNRCASLQPKTKKQSDWTAFVLGCTTNLDATVKKSIKSRAFELSWQFQVWTK
jgi:hypothetical protein